MDIDTKNNDRPVTPDLAVSRRAVAVGMCALTAGIGWQATASPARFTSLTALERRSGGRLGVFALDLETGRTLAHRADERFKLMSSFKGLLTAMVLHEVAAGRDRMDALVRFGPADLMAASPVTTANVAAGEMSVRSLCAATMEHSDNAAANLLMRRLGGPPALTAFLRATADQVTSVNHYEGPLLANAAMPADSTTPRAIITTLRGILLGSVLPPEQRRTWAAWMAGNTVGLTRLRAAFPPDWRGGDRTGTADGICNDYAFALRPGRAPLLISAYYAAPGMPLAAQEAVLRKVGRLVVGWQE